MPVYHTCDRKMLTCVYMYMYITFGFVEGLNISLRFKRRMKCYVSLLVFVLHPNQGVTASSNEKFILMPLAIICAFCKWLFKA